MVVKFWYGNFGSGKTAHAVYELLKDQAIEGRRPISNMKGLDLPYSVTITPMDIIKALKPQTKEEEEFLEKMIKSLKDKSSELNDMQIHRILNNTEPKNMFLDEIGKWWDARNHSSQLNRFLGYFIDQTRKRNMNTYVTDQHASGYDLRGRQVTDFLTRCVGQYYPEAIKDEMGRRIPFRFHYWKMDIQWEKVKYYYIPASLMKYIYPFYNTYEHIVPAEIQLGGVI